MMTFQLGGLITIGLISGALQQHRGSKIAQRGRGYSLQINLSRVKPSSTLRKNYGLQWELQALRGRRRDNYISRYSKERIKEYLRRFIIILGKRLIAKWPTSRRNSSLFRSRTRTTLLSLSPLDYTVSFQASIFHVLRPECNFIFRIARWDEQSAGCNSWNTVIYVRLQNGLRRFFLIKLQCFKLSQLRDITDAFPQ